MGRGDQKSRQGKVRRGTYGKTRPKQATRNRMRRERLAAEAAAGGSGRSDDRAARAAVGGAGLAAGAAVLGGLAGA